MFWNRKVQKGLMLHLGVMNKQNPAFTSMSGLRGSDIIHMLEKMPYPLSKESCLTIVAPYVVQQIKPWLFIPFMNECWRLLVPEGQMVISHPYGVNMNYLADPINCNPIIESTWQYFDPDYPAYSIHKPKPWKVEKGFPVWQVTGNMEVILQKREVNAD